MSYQRHSIHYTALLLLSAGGVAAGPFDPAAGQPGSLAVSMTDSSITTWASAYSNYNIGANVDATWQTPEKALGAATGSAFDIVSLGEGGSITISFNGSISDGPGWDFAVFENSFNDTFLELAWVSVSSDGSNFVRFPAFSFTPNPVGAFGAVDPTNISGFAGKYQVGFGASFDLSIFAGVAGLNVNAITHIRIDDVIGDGRHTDDWPAAFGGPNRIYDPYLTTGSGGFDLEAVGARYFAANPPPPTPEPNQVPLCSPICTAALMLGLAWLGASRVTQTTLL